MARLPAVGISRAQLRRSPRTAEPTIEENAMNRNAWYQQTLKLAAAALVTFAVMFAVNTSVQADPKSVARGWNNTAISWMDHTQGVAEAARTGKPILTVVQATWCSHCERYKKVFFDPKVVELSKNFVMVMVDGDREKKLGAKLGPNNQAYVPRTLFLKPDGQLRPELIGANAAPYSHFIDYDTPAELLALMQKAK
jgi:protein-disulfide reductase (glutathione)